MNKLKKTIILTALLMLCTAPMCHADNIDVSFDKITRNLSIGGELGSMYGNSKIMSMIIPSDEELPEISDAEFAADKTGEIDNPLNIMQTSSDPNGKYTYNAFAVGDDTEGYFNIYIAANTMDTPYTEKVFIPQKNKVTMFADKIKSAGSKNEVLSLLEAEYASPEFGADMRYYAAVNSYDAKLAVAESIFNRKNQGKYNSADGVNVLDEDIFMYSYLAYFTQLHSADELKALLDISNSDYSTSDKQRLIKSLNLNELYKTTAVKYLVSLSDKQTILNTAAKKDMYTPEALRDAIYISTINYEFNTAGSWRDAYKILLSHNDILTGLNYSGLSTISENQSKLSKIIKQEYVSCEQLYKFVNDVINEKQPSGGGISNPGRGGTSGGGFSISKYPNSADTSNVDNSEYFSDVPNDFWAKEKINSLYKKNIISGKGDKIFDPYGSISREEFTKMLVNVLGIKPGTVTPDFNDVSETDWFYESVSAAASAGIVDGVGNGCFGTGLNITRQDMVVMTCRALEKVSNMSLPEGETGIFNDYNNIAEYAKGYISSAYKLGIVSGRDNNMFAPTENTTRAEAAVFIYNLLSLL